VKISELVKNPANPRIIKDEKFARLKKSIQEFPQMMELRPIVIDESGMVLGGNMRLEALKSLGKKSIPDHWIKRASELSEEQKKEFIIKDNSSFGEYDWDLLANEWSEFPLTEWGVDIPDDWLASADSDQSKDEARQTLSERFLIPPFSVLDARQGYWQDRKRAWLALGIQSELGRGADGVSAGSNTSSSGKAMDYAGGFDKRFRGGASPGGSPRPAMKLKNGHTVRGDGRGREI